MLQLLLGGTKVISYNLNIPYPEYNACRKGKNMTINLGKICYNALLLLVGVCLIVGAIINIKKNCTYIVIIGGFAIGISAVSLAVKGFISIARA